MSDDPPELIIGGRADAAFRRAALYGDGWIMGAAPPEVFPSLVEKLMAAWREHDRDGEPLKLAIADELILFPASPDPAQVDLLADAAR